MLLKRIIKNCPHHLEQIKIEGLAIDSRRVKKNFIFFALKGSNLNGENYISEAIRKGAKIVICSKKSSLLT